MSFFKGKERRAPAPGPEPKPAPAYTEGQRDTLTGLLSNDALVDECRSAIEAANGGEHVGIVLFSFDGMRELTERSGNLVTDQLLRELSRRLRATVRECDHVGRHSRDEFIVILRQLGGRLETLTLISRLRVALAEPIKTGKSPYVPVVNFGFATPPTDGTTLEALAAAAEKAMLTMREQARIAAKENAVKRIASTRAAAAAATANVAAAEQAVRDADAALADAKRLVVEAKAAVVAALETAKALGVAET
jgi:diguanylate cyclase (GGDEF)-like protein